MHVHTGSWGGERVVVSQEVDIDFREESVEGSNEIFWNISFMRVRIKY